jgi:predicted DNA-binding transcriptional regulator AlpA
MSNELRNKLLADGEVAHLIGMSKSYLRQSRVKGTGPAFLKLGRSVRYRLEDVEAWLQSRNRINTIQVMEEV